MRLINIVLCIFLLGVFADGIESAKILYFNPTMGRSHLLAAKNLLIKLADRGHEVTRVTAFPEKKTYKNLRDIYVPLNQNLLDFAKNVAKYAAGPQMILKFKSFTDLLMETASDMMKTPQFQSLLQEKFDLVIIGFFMVDFNLGLGAHFNCPTVVIFSAGTSGLIDNYVGNLSPVASVPNIMVAKKDPMTFIDRVINFLIHIIELGFIMLIQNTQSHYYRIHFPEEKYPSYSEVRKNVSLVLLNMHFTQGNPRPYIPNMVEVGGLQIKEKPFPLPETIKSWIDGAEHGVIFFSFGSNVKFENLPKEKWEIFPKVFAKLKQRVIWTFDLNELPNKPDNVMIGKWFPQDDILANKNVKLFISHGGLGSTVEAKYHGVPVIGIPIFADQHANVKGIIAEGWGSEVDFDTMTEEKLEATLNEMLVNPKYKEKVQELSTLFRDRPQSAMELATFWIEYVIRHKGAPHMRYQGVDLNFFQSNSLDVLAFILIVIYVTFKIFKFVIVLTCRRICCRRQKEKVN